MFIDEACLKVGVPGLLCVYRRGSGWGSVQFNTALVHQTVQTKTIYRPGLYVLRQETAFLKVLTLS